MLWGGEEKSRSSPSVLIPGTATQARLFTQPPGAASRSGGHPSSSSSHHPPLPPASQQPLPRGVVPPPPPGAPRGGSLASSGATGGMNIGRESGEPPGNVHVSTTKSGRPSGTGGTAGQQKPAGGGYGMLLGIQQQQQGHPHQSGGNMLLGRASRSAGEKVPPLWKEKEEISTSRPHGLSKSRSAEPPKVRGDPSSLGGKTGGAGLGIPPLLPTIEGPSTAGGGGQKKVQ